MKSIGVIGVGFVGTAIIEGMRHAFRVVAYDKAKGLSDTSVTKGTIRGYVYESDPDPISDVLSKTDGPIFVCVPTPMNEDGSCNTSIVEEVVHELNASFDNFSVNLTDGLTTFKRTVVIKSTVVPGTTEKLNNECSNLNVCFNPEFLREANPIEDFKNQDRIIIGGPREGTSQIKQIYQRAYPDVPVTKTSSTIAEMVKYVTNCFLATKVSFANEIKQVCDGLDIDYDKVIEYTTKDKRLGSSHWAVPGPMPASDGSGKFLPGFSGSCFCKDLNALIFRAKELGIDPKVMASVWEKNLEVRPEKDWLNLIGRAVNE